MTRFVLECHKVVLAQQEEEKKYFFMKLKKTLHQKLYPQHGSIQVEAHVCKLSQ